MFDVGPRSHSMTNCVTVPSYIHNIPSSVKFMALLNGNLLWNSSSSWYSLFKVNTLFYASLQTHPVKIILPFLHKSYFPVNRFLMPAVQKSTISINGNTPLS